MRAVFVGLLWLGACSPRVPELMSTSSPLPHVATALEPEAEVDAAPPPHHHHEGVHAP